MIIVVMVAVTGLISICLVVAIICVRRRSVSLHPGRSAGRDRIRANGGTNRGRDAGDGAEGVHFPLKHEYGYPIDGTGYMMGISPTPSDLDILKLGYPHLHPSSVAMPYMGAANGGVDSAAHVLGWTGLNAQGAAVCYPIGDSLNYHNEQNMDTSPVDSNHSVAMRLPMYAPFARIASTAGSDTATIRLVHQHQHSSLSSQQGGAPSSACLSFTSASPIPSDSHVVTSTSLGDSYAGQPHISNPMGLVLIEDAHEFEARNSGNNYPHYYHSIGQPVRNSCGAYDGHFSASRPSLTVS